MKSKTTKFVAASTTVANTQLAPYDARVIMSRGPAASMVLTWAICRGFAYEIHKAKPGRLKGSEQVVTGTELQHVEEERSYQQALK